MNVENNKIEFGKKIRRLRKEKGLTQEQLSELIGIDNRHLSRIETGIHYPTFKIMKKLAKALDVNLESLDEVSIDDTIVSDKIYLKSLQILNSAKTDEEKKYYYKVLALAKLGLKINSNNNCWNN